MTSQECPAEVIWEEQAAGIVKPRDLVEALADAGLLIPDLPAPDGAEEGKPYWYSSTYGIAVGQLAPGGRQDVMLWDSEPGGVAYMGIEGARELAYALLAAAKLAEFAPNAVSSLAEEEWEYGVQSREYSEYAKMWSGWGHFAIPFDKQRTRKSCEQFIKGRLSPRFEYRLVRRRVSPVEVVK